MEASAVANSPQKSVRYAALDVARGLAVLGAAFIHSMIACQLWSEVPQTWWKGALNIGFRAVTPTFFVIFGVMLELVYVRRAEAGDAVAGRLLRRAGLCWIGFAAGSVTAALVGSIAPSKALAAVILLGDAPWTSVLRFYTIALVLAIGIVHLRIRRGRLVPWYLLAGVWALSPLLGHLPLWLSGKGEALRFLWGSTFGTPAIWVGGSVWHNLSFVAMGMILGSSMRARSQLGQSPFPVGMAVLLSAMCLCVLAGCAMVEDPFTLARQYAGDRMALRTAHHPAYYAGGGLSALILLGVIFAMVRGDGGFWAEVGRRSLLVFAISGVLLNLAPARFEPGLALGCLLAAVHMAILIAVVAVSRRRAGMAHDR